MTVLKFFVASTAIAAMFVINPVLGIAASVVWGFTA
jgi:hypothetical protein